MKSTPESPLRAPTSARPSTASSSGSLRTCARFSGELRRLVEEAAPDAASSINAWLRVAAELARGEKQD